MFAKFACRTCKPRFLTWHWTYWFELRYLNNVDIPESLKIRVRKYADHRSASMANQGLKKSDVKSLHSQRSRQLEVLSEEKRDSNQLPHFRFSRTIMKHSSFNHLFLHACWNETLLFSWSTIAKIFSWPTHSYESLWPKVSSDAITLLTASFRWCLQNTRVVHVPSWMREHISPKWRIRQVQVSRAPFQAFVSAHKLNSCSTFQVSFSSPEGTPKMYEYVFLIVATPLYQLVRSKFQTYCHSHPPFPTTTTLEGPFSAVATPILVINGSLESVRRDLYE